MALIYTIPLNRVRITPNEVLWGHEGFVLVWGVTHLRIYREEGLHV